MTSAVWDLGRYRPLARGLLRDWPRLRRRLDQSDLANNVLLKAHQALDKFRGSTEDDFLKWLRAILANEFRDVCRHECAQQRDPAFDRSIDEALTRSSVRLGAFLEASGASPSEAAQQRETTLALAAALETLPADEYEMVVAHDLEGETFRQIGARLGVSAGTVLRRVHDVRQKLTVLLAGHDSR